MKTSRLQTADTRPRMKISRLGPIPRTRPSIQPCCNARGAVAPEQFTFVMSAERRHAGSEFKISTLFRTKRERRVGHPTTVEGLGADNHERHVAIRFGSVRAANRTRNPARISGNRLCFRADSQPLARRGTGL